MKSMKRFAIEVAFFLALFANDLFPQSGGKIKKDSVPALTEIESAITFLEDTQKVAQLTRQLRLLAEAQRRVMAVDNEATKSEPKYSVDLSLMLKKVLNRSREDFKGVIAELRLVTYLVNIGRNGIRTATGIKRFLYYISVIMASVAIGGFVAYLLLRTGRRIRKQLDGTPPEFRREKGVISFIFNEGALGAGLSSVFILLGLFASGYTIQKLFWNIAIWCIVYSIINIFIEILFSTRIPTIRLVRCPDDTALPIRNRLRMIFRLSLVAYIFYKSAGVLGLTTTSRFIVIIYLIILTVTIPVMLYRVRCVYVEPVLRICNQKKSALFHILVLFLSKLYLIALLNGIFTVLIALVASSYTYRYFLSGTASTLGVLVIWVCILWILKYALNRLSGYLNSFVMKYQVSRNSIKLNIRIISTVIYLIITLVFLIIISKIWGFAVENIIKSEASVFCKILRIIAACASAWIGLQAIHFIIGRFQYRYQNRMVQSEGANILEIEKRVSTLGNIFRKIATVSFIIIAVIMVLDEMGFDVKAMVAGLGIAGVAIGFGAQNLVRDIISGLFVIFENRIRVGDVAVINGTGGFVENVNLRTTILRSLDGTVHVFSNGSINTLSNMTHQFSYYVFDIGVAYKEDVDRVMQVLKDLGEEMRTDPEFKDSILEPIEILGVDAFTDSAVLIKARIKTLPIKQWLVGREMNRRIKKRFDEMGIEIPFPHRKIYFGNIEGETGGLFDGNMSNREAIKKLIREIIEEQKKEKK